MLVGSWVKRFDWVLVAIVVAIVVLGMATFYKLGPRAAGLIDRQVMWLGIGLVVMILVSFLDYRILRNFSSSSIIIYLLATFLLLLAFASKEIRGVNSWIVLRNLTFEPAEFGKLALIILLAKYFSQKHVEIYRAHHILASAIYTLIPAGLTLMQPDLGSTMIFVVIWLAMLFFSGIKRKHLLTILMVGTILATFGWFIALKPYQRTRVTSFINPYLDPRGSGYNTLQSKVSFGSGRLTGIVFARGTTEQMALVPEPYNDFAFATYARKFGFVGVVGLLALVLALMLRLGSTAVRTDNNFAKLFTLGFMTLIFGHVFINAGMNMGLLPITGIPFSFLSYGGSHLITLMIGLGIIQNIRLSTRA